MKFSFVPGSQLCCLVRLSLQNLLAAHTEYFPTLQLPHSLPHTPSTLLLTISHHSYSFCVPFVLILQSAIPVFVASSNTFSAAKRSRPPALPLYFFLTAHYACLSHSSDLLSFAYSTTLAQPISGDNCNDVVKSWNGPRLLFYCSVDKTLCANIHSAL